MKGIGGNTKMVIQTSTATRNEIGESVLQWADAQAIKGWLDLASGDSRYSTYYAKVQESTHIFIADYVPIKPGITAENARAVIDGKVYDIMLIDNPMGMRSGSQLEIYLRYTGGQ
jgi:head-tail adaptor